MDVKKWIQALGFLPKENASGVFCKKYSQASEYIIEIDFSKEIINYGNKIQADNKTTQNFSQPENFVVLDCVNRLLETGYQPECILLEPTWKLGHTEKGRLDILVTKEDKAYLMIECKTLGKEFDKELKNLHKDGGQLFSYFQQDKNTEILMLYASGLKGNTIESQNEIIKIEEDYRLAATVKDFFEKWNKLTKDNGVWENPPYNFKPKALTIDKLREIKQEDSSFIFNQFLEILRHNVVSDKPNAFNKIFNLFLCKIYDEKDKENTDEELAFQWIEGKDTDVAFQLRLTDLYKSGMREFLEKTVTDFSDKEFEKEYGSLFAEREDLKQKLKENIIYKLRLEKNNEFAIKEVYDEKSFKENAKVVKEIVQLLEKFKIRYTQKQQYLSDFFELLLTTGLKQESGQFFTPVPVAQFVIKSLPMDTIVKEKLLANTKDDLLPYIIDYASGSGHFLTESMHEIQHLLMNKTDDLKLKTEANTFVQMAKVNHFNWAEKYVYGVEKDYRLVKVGKVGCYLHGDGLANVIHSDGLAHFKHEDYKDKLNITDKDFTKENQQFDIVISNPPYSVSAFKNASRDYYTEKDFDLYEALTDSSSEIEALFIERTKQLLKEDGVAGIILPSSILSNGGIYAKAREIILQYFDIIGITELGSNTFMATGTNTVTLFLKRKNNYDSINLKKAVERFFVNFNDVTLNGIEEPVLKYIQHTWENISLEDYVSLLKKQPTEIIQQHDIYKEYTQKIKAYSTIELLDLQISKETNAETLLKLNEKKAKVEKEFWNTLTEIEQEKLFYFILAYPQQVVVIKSGQKDEEKRFLGYEFSNRRGNEGIHPIQRGKRIAQCTMLFDEDTFENPEKASTYIYKAFHGDYDFEIHESLQNYIKRLDLVDMLTFDRLDFDKNISTSVKKKVKYENIWNTEKLVLLSEVSEIRKGTSITKEKTKDGNIPVVAGGKEPAYFHNEANRDGNIITISASGAYSGYVNYFNEPIFASDCNTIVSKNEDKISTKLIYEFLKSIQKEIYCLQRGQAQPHVYGEDIAKIKIPIPPIDIQKKIVSEIEVLEKKEDETKKEIDKSKEKIDNLFEIALSKNNDVLRLSDDDIFDISIGKRVLKKEFVHNGRIPVYSANVFEPFGYIDKLLIENFDNPSVLWGIDGDWMVNCIPSNYPFYPTDHCGVLRVKNNIINERYLAFVLEKEGKALEFSRTKRASIDRVQGIKIPVPPLETQQEIVSEIEDIENKIVDLEKIIASIPKEKEAVLRKYL